MNDSQHKQWVNTPMRASVHGGHDNETPMQVIGRLRNERNDLRSKSGGSPQVPESERNIALRKELLASQGELRKATSRVAELEAANKKLESEKAKGDIATIASASKPAVAPVRVTNFVPVTPARAPDALPKALGKKKIRWSYEISRVAIALMLVASQGYLIWDNMQVYPDVEPAKVSIDI